MYDGDRLVAELDDDGAVVATLSWGAAGLFAYGSTQYQFDLQGSVVARTSSIGSVLSTHWYDAHGTEQTTPSTDPFGYKGQWGYYTDRETGLILCTHRYLDPGAGRWLTRDPIGYEGGVNLYGYVANGPLARSDSSGTTWTQDRQGYIYIDADGDGRVDAVVFPDGSTHWVRPAPAPPTHSEELPPPRGWSRLDAIIPPMMIGGAGMATVGTVGTVAGVVTNSTGVAGVGGFLAAGGIVLDAGAGVTWYWRDRIEEAMDDGRF